MKSYLKNEVDPDDFNLVSVIDELPLWSAPFGLKLLDTIQMKPDMKVLDIGCGTGFPLVEIAQRLGSSSKVYGIDPWEQALERVRSKCLVYDIENVSAIQGIAELLPFEDRFFDLIVSNNGLTNVQNIQKAVKECSRVCKSDGQLVMAYNLEETMIEFYWEFEQVLKNNSMVNEVEKLKEHILSKRMPLKEMSAFFEKTGFKIHASVHDSFRLRFLDGTTMFNHYLIKYWFLDSWKRIVPEDQWETIFAELEDRLNEKARQENGLILSIPFITLECRKCVAI